MGAQQLAVRAVAENLDEADRVGDALRLGVRGEGELRDLDVETLLAGLRLGPAEAGDLRLAERGPRHHRVVELHRLGVGDRLGGDDALGLGDVSEQELGRHVTDRVDVADVRPHPRVDRDGATVGELDAGALEAVPLDPRREADGLHDLVGLEGGLLAVRGHRHPDRVTAVVDLVDPRRRHDLDAESLVALRELGRDVLVLQRQ